MVRLHLHSAIEGRDQQRRAIKDGTQKQQMRLLLILGSLQVSRTWPRFRWYPWSLTPQGHEKEKASLFVVP